MARLDRQASRDKYEKPDKTEPALTAEPMDRIDPLEPMDSIEPLDPMLSSDPAEPAVDPSCLVCTITFSQHGPGHGTRRWSGPRNKGIWQAGG